MFQILPACLFVGVVLRVSEELFFGRVVLVSSLSPRQTLKEESVKHTDCVQKLSNVKTIDLDSIIRTVLEKNPAIKAKDLLKKLRDKTGLARSTLYIHFSSLESRGKLYRARGFYWIEKPKRENEEARSIFRLSEYKGLMKELKEISDLAVFSPDIGWHKYTYFEGRLPLELRNKVEPISLPIADSEHSDRVALKILLKKVSQIIHDHYRDLT